MITAKENEVSLLRESTIPKDNYINLQKELSFLRESTILKKITSVFKKNCLPEMIKLNVWKKSIISLMSFRKNRKLMKLWTELLHLGWRKSDLIKNNLFLIFFF